MSRAPLRRILIVSTATGYGGAERSIELVAPELARHAQVVVLTCNARHRRNLEASAARTGVRMSVWGLPAVRRRSSLASAALGFLAARLAARPDAVLTNTPDSALIAAHASRLWRGAGKRVWIYVRDFSWTDLPTTLWRLPSAGVVVPGPAVMDRPHYLAPWVEPVMRRRIRVVPDMVPELENIPHSSVRDGRYVLHLATVNPWKGHVHLIRAAERLQAEGRGLWIRSRGVTGNEQLRRRLERQIAAARLNGAAKFELLEHAEDPSSELSGCRSVVVSAVSHSGGPETFGRSVIEAWAHGRPVVAFAAGGPQHLITHGEDGLLVPEADEHALGEALWRLHANPELAERMGARGREKVRRHYSLTSVADRLLDVLGEADAGC